MSSIEIAQEVFDSRIAGIHGLSDNGGDVMDVRHEEFMAMADAFLGPDFDSDVLAQIEALQLTLDEAQSALVEALESHQIDRAQYVSEVNRAHAEIARQCATILGRENFAKLFGVAPSEVSPHLEMDVFMTQPGSISPAAPPNNFKSAASIPTWVERQLRFTCL